MTKVRTTYSDGEYGMYAVNDEPNIEVSDDLYAGYRAHVDAHRVWRNILCGLDNSYFEVQQKYHEAKKKAAPDA